MSASQALPINNSQAVTQVSGDPDSLFLVLPVAFRRKKNRLYFDTQACNGLKCWCEQFRKVTVACPVIPEALLEDEDDALWRMVDDLPFRNQLTFIELPWSHKAFDLIRVYSKTRKVISDLIPRHRYLQFAIGGLFGDWGAMACIEAHKQQRKYAVWADRVEHQVQRRTAGTSLKRRIKSALFSPLAKRLEEYVIRRSSLGLWHGKDTFAVYSKLVEKSYLVHNIHIQESRQIDDEGLAKKLTRIRSEKPLNICYTGRVSDMKAPLEWVAALLKIKRQNIPFKATWLGDGPLLELVKKKIHDENLSDCVEFPGFTAHNQALDTVTEADMMLFTHVTPESPRCLIESLVCGTPIIGYESEYPLDLVETKGGGEFVALRDYSALGDKIIHLHKNREQLVKLVEKAADNGRQYSDTKVFKHRSELIKAHL